MTSGASGRAPSGVPRQRMYVATDSGKVFVVDVETGKLIGWQPIGRMSRSTSCSSTTRFRA